MDKLSDAASKVVLELKGEVNSTQCRGLCGRFRRGYRGWWWMRGEIDGEGF